MDETGIEPARYARARPASGSGGNRTPPTRHVLAQDGSGGRIRTLKRRGAKTHRLYHSPTPERSASREADARLGILSLALLRTGDQDRTGVTCLEGGCSTIELHRRGQIDRHDIAAGDFRECTSPPTPSALSRAPAHVTTAAGKIRKNPSAAFWDYPSGATPTFHPRVGDGIRTRGPHLGKVMRYHCATPTWWGQVPRLCFAVLQLAHRSWKPSGKPLATSQAYMMLPEPILRAPCPITSRWRAPSSST